MKMVTIKELLNLRGESDDRGIRFIKQIKQVEKHEERIEITFQNNKKWVIGYGGVILKYNKIGHVSNTHELKIDSDGHIRTNDFNNKSFTLERVIMLANAFYCDSIPLDLEKYVVNVMDLSGSVFTCVELGIKVNLHPNNLEWCKGSENVEHAGTMLRIFKKCGHVYRISAKDNLAKKLSENIKEPVLLKQVLDDQYIKVK